jgi:hypothetical protein
LIERIALGIAFLTLGALALWRLTKAARTGARLIAALFMPEQALPWPFGSYPQPLSFS